MVRGHGHGPGLARETPPEHQKTPEARVAPGIEGGQARLASRAPGGGEDASHVTVHQAADRDVEDLVPASTRAQTEAQFLALTGEGELHLVAEGLGMRRSDA